MKRPDLHTITFSSFTPHHHEAFFSALTVCQQHTGRDGLQMMGGFLFFFPLPGERSVGPGSERLSGNAVGL